MANKTFTMEQVAKHTAEDDCWIVIDGQVLDISKFLTSHPGGVSPFYLMKTYDITTLITLLPQADILIDGAGKDNTSEFEDTGHSSDAVKQLKGLTVGTVEGWSQEAAEEARAVRSASSAGPNPAVLVAILVVIVGVLLFLTQK
jgi:cytochrome b involved in lipid metabolism